VTSPPAYPPPAPGEPVSPGPVAPGSGTPEPGADRPAHSAEDIQSAVERSKQAGWAWGDEDAKIPDDAALPELLPMAARTMGTFWGQTVQGTGISGAGLAVLRVLAARNGLKSSEVAARGWSTPGTVTTVVDTLVRDGLVRRERDYTDRRVVRLYVTERGLDKLVETLAAVGPRWRDCFDYVDPADEPVIRKFLIDTIERFSTLIRKERST
jgi:DNA-binding MarR family transcriptional regulator